MKNPEFKTVDAGPEVRPPGAEEAAKDITRDTKTFTAAIRTRLFVFLRHLANDDLDGAAAEMEWWTDLEVSPSPSLPSSPARLRSALDAYYADHERICLDPEARNSRHTHVIPDEDKKTWRIQQVLVDPAGHNDWAVDLLVDLDASRAAGEPVVRLRSIAAIAR